MFPRPLRLTRPGLFVTGTDTGVGKTVVACAIAWNLRQASPPPRVGVCKPLATGCRHDREGLVSEDSEALAHFADCRQPLDVICPARFRTPVAPAVAAEVEGTAVDFAAIVGSLELLDRTSDCLLVPIDGAEPRTTVLDLIQSLGYPAVVVCRAGLGTLNHTAMTIRLLKQAGCKVAGLVINGYEADASTSPTRAIDASMSTNRQWLEKMNKVPVLATIPNCPPRAVAPGKGRIPEAILDAVGMTFWADVLREPR